MSRSIALIAIVAFAALTLCPIWGSSYASGQRSSRNDSCGTPADLAARIEICVKPVMGIIEGTLEEWPRNIKDTEDLCERIHQSERCIRDDSRRCARGLHKTIVSTIANSVQRARKRECTRDNMESILRMVNCIEEHTNSTKRMIATIITRMSIIETQMKDLDQKTNGICCAIKSLTLDLKTTFDQVCPKHTETVLRLYRTVLDDVFDIICRSAKCQGDIYQGYKVPKLNYDNGKLIATILRIIFSLDS